MGDNSVCMWESISDYVVVAPSQRRGIVNILATIYVRTLRVAILLAKLEEDIFYFDAMRAVSPASSPLLFVLFPLQKYIRTQ